MECKYLCAAFLLLELSVQLTICEDTSVKFDCLTQQPRGSGYTIGEPDTSPAYLQLSTTHFSVGQKVTVSIVSDYPLKAYILQARSSVDGGADHWASGGPHGWWPGDVRAIRCFSAADTILQYSDDSNDRRIHAVWTMNANAMPNTIYFRASVMAADNKVWTDIKSFPLQYTNTTTTTRAPKVTSKQPSQTVPSTTPKVSTERSKIYELKESILEETIVEFERKNKQLVAEDDAGEEGDWTRLREKERILWKEELEKEKLLQQHKRVEEKKHHDEIIRMEIADKEAHSGIQEPPPPMIENPHSGINKENQNSGSNSFSPVMWLLSTLVFIILNIRD